MKSTLPMVKCRWIVLLILTVYSTSCFSQRNISKSNLLFGPFFKMIHTTQEVKISARHTIQTTVRTRPRSNYKFFGLGKINYSGHDFDRFGRAQLSAIGNITEFRVYGKEKGAMHGFYYGPYICYTHFKLQSASIRAEFRDGNGTAHFADVNQFVKVNLTGVGFQIGTQAYYKSHVVLDWTILGFGFASLGFKGGLEAENTSADFDFRNYPDDVSDLKMGIERVFHFKRTVEPTSINIGAKIPWFMIRMGLSMGFGY